MGKKKAAAQTEKKVILFMSTMGPNAPERTYRCPDGGTVQGTQTNEAPVKYLLRKYGKGITRILCIVSSACREQVPGQTYTPLDHFRREIEQFCGEEGLPYSQEFLKEIDFPEDGGPDTEAALFRAVSRELRAGDEILLETTGGFRNSMMFLLLLSRTLSYAGHTIAGAVYTFFDRENTGKDEVLDVSGLNDLFDLIGGMQELSSFGNVRTLKAYYSARPHDAAIDALLSATESLLDTISLCRTNRISEALTAFNQAMDAAENCADPLLPQLLPAFQEKYGKKMNIPGLIRWCVKSDMTQQALTIYKENIPGYLLSRGDILDVRRDAYPPKKEPYQGDDEAYFRDFANSFFYAAIRGEPGSQYPGYRILCSFETMRDIVLDYSYLLLLRNMTNHAADSVGESQEGRAEKLRRHSPQKYPLPDTTTAKDVQNAILRGLDHMKQRS